MENKEFTKKDLKNKMVVELNDSYMLYNYYDCEMYIINTINIKRIRQVCNGNK